MRMKRTASDAAARAMVAAGADFPFSADEAGDILFGDYLPNLESDTVFADFLRKHHRQRLSLSQHHVDRITAHAVNAYLKAKMLQTEPYAGVRRTLIHLTRRGLRLGVLTDRSEERRVGKECRSRWSPDHEKKKKKETR